MPEFLSQLYLFLNYYCVPQLFKVFVLLFSPSYPPSLLFLLSPLPPPFSPPSQPSHGDKTSNPEVLKWMNDLAKGRKQLKGKCQPVSFLRKEAVKIVIMCSKEFFISTCALFNLVS